MKLEREEVMSETQASIKTRVVIWKQGNAFEGKRITCAKTKAKRNRENFSVTGTHVT